MSHSLAHSLSATWRLFASTLSLWVIQYFISLITIIYSISATRVLSVSVWQQWSIPTDHSLTRSLPVRQGTMSSSRSDVLFAANRDESMRKWHLRKELMVKGQEVLLHTPSLPHCFTALLYHIDPLPYSTSLHHFSIYPLLHSAIPQFPTTPLHYLRAICGFARFCRWLFSFIFIALCSYLRNWIHVELMKQSHCARLLFLPWQSIKWLARILNKILR
jgi:hypothetical protein